jgi:hypothetical protein
MYRNLNVNMKCLHSRLQLLESSFSFPARARARHQDFGIKTVVVLYRKRFA